jgi:ribosomal protein S3AE
MKSYIYNDLFFLNFNIQKAPEEIYFLQKVELKKIKKLMKNPNINNGF